jgi:hypothetical protein
MAVLYYPQRFYDYYLFIFYIFYILYRVSHDPPNYIITLCFQIEDGTKRGESCDISITKNQLEMLHSSLTTWLECMMRTSEEQAEAEAEIERMIQKIRSEKNQPIKGDE